MRNHPVFGTRDLGATYVVRPGSYALIVDHDRVAVLSTPTGIHVPGGGADEGETEPQTLIREVREECGLEVASYRRHASATQLVHAEGEGHFEKHCTYFLVETALGGSGAGEHDHDLVWLPLTRAVERLTAESHRWAVRLLLDRRTV